MALRRIGAVTAAFAVFSFTGPAGLGPSVASARVEQPKPPRALGALKFFVGAWKCTGKLHEMPGRPAGKFTATTEVKVGLGGHWATAVYTQKRTKTNPAPVQAMFLYGYDSKKKRYISSYRNNYGARAELSSTGWKGNKWVDEGELHDREGHQMRMRMTLHKLGKARFKALAEFSGPDGAWHPFNESECRR